MAKYKRKLVVIEAVQLKVENLGELAVLCPTARMSLAEGVRELRAYIPNHASFNAREGEMIAFDGDFIVKEVNGQIYPCKPKTFADLYEPA